LTGAEFPPLTVFWDGEHYWLADGFHRLGAYNIVMQALELPGLDIDCEVIEGAQRDAILYACGTNAEHGIPRTNTDKQNAVKTVLTNPLVALNDDGVPWTDRAIARICKVHWNTVAKWRAEYLEKSPDRAVTRGGTTYTMNTANIGGKAAPAAGSDVQPNSISAATEPETAPDPSTEPPAPPAAPTAVVVEFKSQWDFIYTRLKEIDRAVEALPEPHVAASRFPETLAHGVTSGVARVRPAHFAHGQRW
jgi:hypothetical protein